MSSAVLSRAMAHRCRADPLRPCCVVACQSVQPIAVPLVDHDHASGGLQRSRCAAGIAFVSCPAAVLVEGMSRTCSPQALVGGERVPRAHTWYRPTRAATSAAPL